LLLVDELRESWRTESRDHRVGLVAIVAIGVALRLAYLAQPMRYDEAVTYMYFVRLDWADALTTYTYPNNHLFHTALAKAAVSLFGSTPWALRLPAFLAGCAVIPATYAAARALYDGRAALVAAALVAASGALILYATNARGYSLVVLAFLLLTLQGARLLRGSPSHEWVHFAVIAALGLWTIPVMLYPLGAVALWLALTLLVDDRRGELRRLGVALGIVGLLTLLAYGPVVSREGFAAVARNRFVAASGWLEFFTTLPASVGQALSSWSLGIPPLVGFALLFLAAIALRHHGSVSRFRVGLPLAAFVWCSWLLVVNHRAPFARVWLWLLPLAASLAGAGAVRLLERGARTASWIQFRAPAIATGIAVALGLSVALSRAVRLSTDTGSFRDAPAAAEHLRRVLRPGDRVLAPIPSNGPLQYYMHRLGLDSGYLSLDERRASRIVAVVDAAEGHLLSTVIARSPARDSTRFTPPRIIARLPWSALVLFERRAVPSR
jgi:4-amino-4-deoxy-L-arabinose transferase-like glycosyltransferase